MKAGKRSAEDAPPAGNGGAKRAKHSGGEDNKLLSIGECKGEGRDCGTEQGAGGAPHVPLKQSEGGQVTKKGGEKAAVDPEEELMRALEEDIEAEGAAVERVGGTAAVPADEDDDYDESEDEDEDDNADKGDESNTTRR